MEHSSRPPIQLSDEIVVQILEYLPLQDRLELRNVNRQWQRLCCEGITEMSVGWSDPEHVLCGPSNPLYELTHSDPVMLMMMAVIVLEYRGPFMKEIRFNKLADRLLWKEMGGLVYPTPKAFRGTTEKWTEKYKFLCKYASKLLYQQCPNLKSLMLITNQWPSRRLGKILQRVAPQLDMLVLTLDRPCVTSLSTKSDGGHIVGGVDLNYFESSETYDNQLRLKRFPW